MPRNLKPFAAPRAKRPVSERTNVLRELVKTDAWIALKEEMAEFAQSRASDIPVSGAIPELIRFTLGSIVERVLDEFIELVESK